MKVVILAGGLGSRLSEETDVRPKPMVEIGGKPIIWHIMKIYAAHGFNEFVVCLGYKGFIIKEYFANLFLHQSDITINLENNQIEIHNRESDNWKITLVDTGRDSMTGGRIKRIQSYVGNSSFMLTYGDGLGNINVKGLLDFHKAHGKSVTVTSIKPDGRFGVLGLDENNRVNRFNEKSTEDVAWINGGFFVCEPGIFKYLENREDLVFEKEPIQSIVQDQQMDMYAHDEFWQCMDTYRDWELLNQMFKSGKAPWVR